jgi:FMN phosphatase YigB (HAD superfamily)
MSMKIQIGLPEDKVRKFVDQIFELLAKNIAPPMLFPGMNKVIQELGKENYIVIITTNVKCAVARVLADNGLLDQINLIMGAEQHGSKSEKICRTIDLFLLFILVNR